MIVFGWVLLFLTPALLSSAFAIAFARLCPRLTRAWRSLFSAIFGSLIFGLIIVTRDSPEWEKMIVFGLVLGAISIAIGLPFAFLTSRWQDKKRADGLLPDVFE